MAARAHVALPVHAAPLSPLTVLFVHQSGDLYGSDRMLLSTASALQQAGGHAIVLLPCAGPLLQALRSQGLEAHVLSEAAVFKLSRAALSPRGLCALVATLPRAWRQWGRCVAGRPVHLVVSNTLAVLGGVPMAWRFAAPHLWHVHEIVEHPRWAARWLPWLVHRFAHRVVCNSQATQRALLARAPALAGRTQVVWNGISDPRPGSGSGASVSMGAATPALQAAFRPHGVPLAVGLVGRINRMKGHQLLLHAACLLRRRGITDFSLVFVGDPPPGQNHHLEQLQQQVATLHLADRVVITGFVPDTAAAYAALDIVCMPSTEAESFGLVAVEAMAMGLPVVAARIGGLPELVEHGRTGFLHAAGQAQALADALAPLLQSRLLRRCMGQAGRRRWEQCFAAHTMQQQMLAELLQAAGGPGRFSPLRLPRPQLSHPHPSPAHEPAHEPTQAAA